MKSSLVLKRIALALVVKAAMGEEKLMCPVHDLLSAEIPHHRSRLAVRAPHRLHGNNRAKFRRGRISAPDIAQTISGRLRSRFAEASIHRSRSAGGRPFESGHFYRVHFANFVLADFKSSTLVDVEAVNLI
jgi:hypothetical protein